MKFSKILGRGINLFMLIWFAGCQWITPSDQSGVIVPTQISNSQKKNSESIPFISDVLPAENSTVSINQVFTIHFTEEMNHSSVEAAFEFSPRIAGAFQWEDDRTVNFTPDQQFTLKQELLLEINSSAMSSSGKTLNQTYSFSYHVAPPLKLMDTKPSFETRDISPEQDAFYVSFNLPVVDFLDDSQEFPAAFQIEPVPTGIGKWISSSTYAFFPDAGLIGGQSYKLLINRQLKSIYGSILEVDQKMEWTFQTDGPKILSISPENTQQIPLDQNFKIKFNQPMLTESVAVNFRFHDLNGTPVMGRFVWNELATELEFIPEITLSRGTVYLLEIIPGSKTKGGGVLSDEILLSYTTIQTLSVVATTPEDGQPIDLVDGNKQISLYFSAAINPNQLLTDYVKVFPEVDNLSIQLTHDLQTIWITADFQPGLAYQVLCSGGIADKWGGTLGEDYLLDFFVSPPAPEITIYSLYENHSVIISPNIYSLNVDVVNLTTVQTKISRINFEEYISLINNLTDVVEGEVVKDFRQPLTPLKNKVVQTNLYLDLNEVGLPSGIYCVELSADGLETIRFFVLVNEDYIFGKISDNQIFVWLTNAYTLQPDTDQLVKIKNDQNETVYEEFTNQDGVFIWQSVLPDTENTSYWIETIDSRTGASSLLNADWTDHSFPALYGLSYEQEAGTDRVFWEINKSLFTLGETISGLGYLQRYNYESYEPFPDSQIQLVLNSVDGEDSAVFNVPLTENGLFNFEYQLPLQMADGIYSLSILGFENESKIIQIQRKPISENFSLNIEFSSKEYFFDSTLSATINLSTRYGNFDKTIPFVWRVFCNQCSAKTEDWVNLTGELDKQLDFSDQLLVAEGNGFFDQVGTSEIEFPIANLNNFSVDKTIPQELILEVYLQDANQIITYNSKSILVYPERTKIEIHVDSFLIEPDEVMIKFLSKDWRDQAIGAIQFDVKFQKLYALKDTENGQNQWVDLFQTTLKTTGRGEAALPVYPNGPGIYRIQVINKLFVSEKVFFVSGTGLTEFPLDEFGQLPLITDRQTITDGKPVQLFIPNPFSEPAYVYLTVEQSSVLDYQFFNMDSGQKIIDLNIDSTEKEEIFVSVVLIARDSHKMVQGYTSVFINREETALIINSVLHADDQSNSITLTTTDNSGIEHQSTLIVEVIAGENQYTEEQLDRFKNTFAKTSGIGVITSGLIKNYKTVDQQRNNTLVENISILTNQNPLYIQTYKKVIILPTDESGKLSIDLAQYSINPQEDSLLVYAIADGVNIGSKQINLQELETVFIVGSAPQKIFLGDEFEVSVEVVNPTPVTQEGVLDINLDGLEMLTSSGENQLILSSGEKQTFIWKFKSISPDVASINISFMISDQIIASFTDTIHVFEPKNNLEKITIGKITRETEFVVPFYAFESAEFNMAVIPSLSGILYPAADKLLESSQWIEEKMISVLSISNILYLQNKTGNDSFTEQKVNQADLKVIIDDLLKSQNTDGGWSIISSQPSDMETTLLAVWSLINYQKDYQDIPDEVFQNAEGFILNHLLLLDELNDDYSCDLLSWQFYALSLLGAENIDPLVLLPSADSCSVVGKSMISLGVNQVWAGDQRGRDLLLSLVAEIDGENPGVYFESNKSGLRIFSDDLQSMALLTYALSKQDPANEILENLVDILFSRQERLFVWQSPIQTGLSILAMSVYIEGRGIPITEYSANVNLNGTDILHVDSALDPFNNAVISSSVSNLLIPQSENELSITHDDGSGNLYFYAYLETVASSKGLPAANQVSINRFIVNTDQNPICGEQDLCEISNDQFFTRNHPQIVVLQLVVYEPLDHVFLIEELPAGVRKIEHPSFYQNSSELIYSPLMNWDEVLINLNENSETSLEFYTPVLSSGTYYLIYSVIPEIPGSFYWPDITLYSLADADLSNGNAGTMITIQK